MSKITKNHKVDVPRIELEKMDKEEFECDFFVEILSLLSFLYQSKQIIFL